MDHTSIMSASGSTKNKSEANHITSGVYWGYMPQMMYVLFLFNARTNRIAICLAVQ